MAEPDPFTEVGSPPLHAFDFFAGVHAALRNFDIARREVHRQMRLHRRPATEAQIAKIHDVHEVAMAVFRNNEVEHAECGWAAEDLECPPPWWKVEAELLAHPDPLQEVVVSGSPRAEAQEQQSPKYPDWWYKPGPKSRWPKVKLQLIAAGLHAGKSLEWCEENTGIAHQRISELRARCWDRETKKLRVPSDAVFDGDDVVLPPRR
jgi:hypothetical protein